MKTGGVRPAIVMGVAFAWSVGICGCASTRGGAGSANVFVCPQAGKVQRVAVMPFRAPTELIGTSVSDLFVTELMKLGRYELVERGQLSRILGETDLQLSALTQNQAVAVGRLAGADAVVIGTVSEYENVAAGGRTRPSVGVSVRLVDVTTGRVLWSVDHSGRGPGGQPLIQQARVVIGEMVAALNRQLR